LQRPGGESCGDSLKLIAMKFFLPRTIRPAALLLLAALLLPHLARVSAAAPVIQLKLLAEGLTAPIALSSLPDGSGRLVVADQAGMVHLLSRDGQRSDRLFLDIRPKLIKLNAGMDERGISGFAFHPRFKENRKFFVAYNAPLRAGAPADWNTTMRVSEFKVSEQDAGAASSDSERVVLEIDKPDWTHNSGRIAFGPDGLLYITVGDGGGPNDVGRLGHAPEGNGQHLQTLLGKILRIDIDHGNSYGIPRDNPYADGKKGKPEIYAYGIRNPWGLSFDRGGAHECIVADVGQERWEEVNIIVNGGNYGWRLREGFDGFDLKDTRSAPANPAKTGADGKPFVDPVLVYKTQRGKAEPDSLGASITGGYVYRGKAIPSLEGKYVFGDWSGNMAVPDGSLLIATREKSAGGAEKWTAARLATKDSPDGKVKAYVWAFGEDDEGELYLLTNGANLVSGTRGKVYKILPL